jgi:serine/threonine-protein kinase
MLSKEELNVCNQAIEKRFINLAQLQECQEIQKKIDDMGTHKSIVDILLEKKYLSGEQLAAIQRGSVKDTKALGDFELLAKLGEGGMGTVYKARQKHMDRVVALKVLNPMLAKNKDYIPRFYREARHAAKLTHINIVSAYEVGEAQGFHYLAMEYVEGKSLDHIIEEKKIIPEAEALNISIQVARALGHAEKHGLIHRDIKPENIIITKGNIVKLIDLGLAKSVYDEETSLTKTGSVIGTPHYIAPEQAKGLRDVDIRADIYSLGATLYHMVTGAPPFQSDSSMAVITKHINEKPVPPVRRNPAISESISRVIERMLEKNPYDRYQTAQELLEDLQSVKEGKDPKLGQLELLVEETPKNKKKKTFLKPSGNMKASHPGQGFLPSYEPHPLPWSFLIKMIIGLTILLILFLLYKKTLKEQSQPPSKTETRQTTPGARGK